MSHKLSPSARAAQPIHSTEEELFAALGKNYDCLRTCCRLGKFEDHVASISDVHGSNGEVFQTFSVHSKTGRSVPFREAVDDCYRLLRYLSTKAAGQHGILM